MGGISHPPVPGSSMLRSRSRVNNTRPPPQDTTRAFRNRKAESEFTSRKQRPQNSQSRRLGRGYGSSPPTNSEVSRLREGAARGPGKVTFALGRGSRRGPGSPRPAPSHLPEGPDCGPEARGPCRPPTRLGSRRLRTYPAPWCCLPARRARSRAHSRFLLPGSAAGRWRFLPDASRRPAPPAGCAEPPGRAGRPAVLRVRRRLPVAGRLAPARSRRLSCAPAAETRCPPASQRTRARAPAQREPRRSARSGPSPWAQSS